MSSCEKYGKGYRVRFRHNGRQVARNFPTKKNALDWQKSLDANGPAIALKILNEPDVSPVTVGEYVGKHIDNLTGVTKGTKKSYHAFIPNHMGDIAQMPIALLDREVLSSWVNRLAGQGLSGKSIANIHGLLSAALNAAVEDKLVIKNPCRGMRLPRTDHVDKEMIFLTQDEFDDLYSRIDEHYQAFVLTLVMTGMRFSEATALTVGDIDVETSSARIRQAWKMTGLSKKELGAPKSKKSNRTIGIPLPALEAILPLLDDRSSGDFLFTTATKKVIGQGFFYKRIWSPAVQGFAGDEIKIDHDKGFRKVRVVTRKGAGKHPRVHDLRHTFVAWAMRKGASLPVIQAQLGHEKITTTIDTYGHLARSDRDALASVIATYRPTPRAIEG